MKIVLDSALTGWQETFAKVGNVTAIEGRDIRNEHLQDADALIIRSRTKINESLLKNTSIKFIGSAVAGLDHIQPHYMNHPEIIFYSAQGCNSNAVAEYVITSIITLANQMNFTVEGKSIAIIGVGHVGRKVADYAQALGMHTLLNDPPRFEEETDFHQTSLEDCMSADFITVHTPLTTSGKNPTYRLLNSRLIAMMSPKTIIINAARGGIIDENALLQQPLKARVIDCWENEPNIMTNLLNMAEISTPHIAGHSFDAKLNGTLMCFKAFCRVFNLTPPDIALSQKPAHPKIDTNASASQILNTACQVLRDTKKLKENPSTFEQQRINYPIRFEFKHYSLNSNKSSLKNLGFNHLKD